MRPAFFVLLAMSGCDTSMTPSDAGGAMDAGMGDTDAGNDGGNTDPDAGTIECPSGQHMCGDGCIELLPNNPSNGCALGCGEPCPVADAICNPDGTCGMMGCEPMTCESLMVECGVIENGCGGRSSCGSCDTGAGEVCMDGTCVVTCSVDPTEPNDSDTSVTSRGSLGDFDEPVVTVDAIIDPGSDEDWFRYRILDQNDGGAPVVTIGLQGVSPGSDLSIAAFFDCDTNDQQSTCNSGTTDNSLYHGCTSVGLGTDTVEIATDCGGVFDSEDGDLYIRVRYESGASSCVMYTVRTGVM